MSHQVITARVKDALRNFGDDSFDLIHADPPYFRILAQSWDRQWKTRGDYLSWLGGVLEDFRRVLKPNGSLYLWASSEMAASVEVEAVAPRFEVLSSIVWAKKDGGGQRVEREGLRSYLPTTERVIFAEHRGADSVALGESGYGAEVQRLRDRTLEPIRAYLDAERIAAGISLGGVDRHLGTQGMARHYFRDQFALPTAEVYAKLQDLFNPNGGGLRREYEELRREYEELRREYEELRREYEELRRPFAVSSDVPHEDVWTYASADRGAGRHPAEKPLDMMRNIVSASTREGARVLDAFAGSGTMTVACTDLGRDVVAVEMDADLCADIERRADRHEAAKTGQLHRVEMAPIRGPLFPRGIPC